MGSAPKAVRLLLLAAMLLLFYTLGGAWVSEGPLSAVAQGLLVAVLLHLPFQWGAIVKMYKQ